MRETKITAARDKVRH